jgi:phenylacetate-CoA ligase
VTRRIRGDSANWLLRRVLLPLGDVAFRQRMMPRLRYVEGAQWWDRDRLHSERDRILRQTIRTIYEEVPFYRSLFDQRGISPADIRTPEDLKLLPLTTKEMLRAQPAPSITRRTGHRRYTTSTSGSTGSNFFVLEDAPTAGWYRASTILAFEWSGWRMGDRVMQFGMTTSRTLDRRMKDALLRCHYTDAADLSDTALDRHLSTLDRKKIEHVWGYPGSIFQLAQRALETGWNRPLNAVVTWGDTLHGHYRLAIERAFQTRVFDTYGCGEGMQISAQCGHENTYHVHTLDVVVETVDDQGEAVASGEPGNIVLTRLHPGPMPFVRYNIGDVGTLGGHGRCPCGRGYDLMRSIQGRSTDIVITPTGNRLIVHFFTGVLEHFQEIESFQVVQPELESLVVRVVPRSGFTPTVERRLIESLQARGAGSMRIAIEVVKEIPLPASGKYRFVISEIALAHEPQGR